MGKLVAVEGPDLAGKTTLLQHLGLQFRERGFSVQFFRFPPDERSREVDLLYEVFATSDDPMERQITLVGMFNAYGPRILAALRENDLVVIDRYILSALVACQALGLDPKPVQEALRSAIIPPDVTIIYTGEPFQMPEDMPEARKAYRAKVAAAFVGDLADYRFPLIRVTNEAAHAGKFSEFVTHLADQVLGKLRRPLHKEVDSG